MLQLQTYESNKLDISISIQHFTFRSNIIEISKNAANWVNVATYDTLEDYLSKNSFAKKYKKAKIIYRSPELIAALEKRESTKQAKALNKLAKTL